MPSYIVFSLLAALCFATSTMVGKFASKHRFDSDWLIALYFHLAFIPPLLIMPFVLDISIPQSGFGYIFLYGSLFFLGNILYMFALRKLDASTMAPFFQLQSALIALFAFMFLGERFPATNYLFVLLILVGSVLVSIDEKMSIKTYLSVGTLYIIGMQVLHSLANLSTGFGLKLMSQFNFIFWGNSIAVALALIVVPLVYKGSLKASKEQLLPMSISGVLSVIGAVALYTAFQTNLTISAAIALLSTPIIFIVVLILSRFKPELLEYHPPKVYLVRFAGVALILLAALKLSLG